MKWVKASERLPGWHKEATWRHPSAEIVNEKMWTSVAMELCSHLLTELEWLDESPLTEVKEQQGDLEFAKWLEENTVVIKEEKITLYRYCGSDGWGNYTLDDIYAEYKDKS